MNITDKTYVSMPQWLPKMLVLTTLLYNYSTRCQLLISHFES